MAGRARRLSVHDVVWIPPESRLRARLAEAEGDADALLEIANDPPPGEWRVLLGEERGPDGAIRPVLGDLAQTVTDGDGQHWRVYDGDEDGYRPEAGA